MIARVISTVALFLVLCATSASLHAQQAANPNASDTTSAVLKYFIELKQKSSNRLLLGQDLGHGNNILSGHSLGYDAFVGALHAQIGRWVGLIGGDYGLDGNHSVSQTNQLLIDYWNRGGLVTLSWHFDNPWTGGSSWDTNRNENLYELITPGNVAYERWQSQLREIAQALKPLQDAGVVVLWRPLHEMNGDWFWWGAKSWQNHENAYKDLYRNMFSYLTDEQGLDNLLWVYSVANTWNRTLLNYYPGNGNVDIVGIDVYGDNVDTYDSGQDYADLRSLGHPMGLTEFGPTLATANGNYDYRRLINKIKTSYPEFVFSYSWSDWFEGSRQVKVAYASNQNATQTFNDPWVITRDEINLDSDPIDDPGNPPVVDSGIPTGEVRIKNLWTNTYLHQNSNFAGADVSLHSLVTDWNSQIWNLESSESGSYHLRSRWGGNLLNDAADYNESPVNVYTQNDNWSSQMWFLERVRDDIFRIRNRWTGRYLHTSDQVNVTTYDLNQNWWSQWWELERVRN